MRNNLRITPYEVIQLQVARRRQLAESDRRTSTAAEVEMAASLSLLGILVTACLLAMVMP